MRIPGKLIILAVFAIGLAGALFNVQYQRQMGRRALEFWKAEAAMLIAKAPRVELRRLSGAQSSKVNPMAGEPIDISQARGFVNVRRALVLDMSYDWSASESQPPIWSFSLHFSDDDREATVLLTEAGTRVALSGQDASVEVYPSTAEALRQFLIEQFPPPTSR